MIQWNKKIAYWFSLLLMVLFACGIVCVGPVRAHYQNTIYLNTVVHAGQSVVSDCLVEGGQTVLLGEVAGEQDILILFESESSAYGILECYLVEPEQEIYLSAFLSDEIVFLSDGVSCVDLYLVPLVDVELLEEDIDVDVYVSFTNGEQVLSATFRATLPGYAAPVDESTEEGSGEETAEGDEATEDGGTTEGDDTSGEEDASGEGEPAEGEEDSAEGEDNTGEGETTEDGGTTEGDDTSVEEENSGEDETTEGEDVSGENGSAEGEDNTGEGETTEDGGTTEGDDTTVEEENSGEGESAEGEEVSGENDPAEGGDSTGEGETTEDGGTAEGEDTPVEEENSSEGEAAGGEDVSGENTIAEGEDTTVEGETTEGDDTPVEEESSNGSEYTEGEDSSGEEGSVESEDNTVEGETTEGGEVTEGDDTTVEEENSGEGETTEGEGVSGENGSTENEDNAGEGDPAEGDEVTEGDDTPAEGEDSGEGETTEGEDASGENDSMENEDNTGEGETTEDGEVTEGDDTPAEEEGSNEEESTEGEDVSEEEGSAEGETTEEVEIPVYEDLILESLTAYSKTDYLPVCVSFPEETAQLEIRLVDVETGVEMDLPPYTRYSVDGGDSWYMLYYGGSAEICGEDLLILGMVENCVLLDFSGTGLDGTQALCIQVMASTEADCHVGSVEIYSMDAYAGLSLEEEEIIPILTTAGPLTLSERGADGVRVYSLERLVQQEDGTLVYEPVGYDLFSVTFGNGTVELYMEDVLPSAGTYRLNVEYHFNDICFAKSAHTFFVNYADGV